MLNLMKKGSNLSKIYQRSSFLPPKLSVRYTRNKHFGQFKMSLCQVQMWSQLCRDVVHLCDKISHFRAEFMMERNEVRGVVG